MSTKWGGKIEIKKKRASYLREGRRDEHKRGAGRGSSRPITMGLLLETVEDVTWRKRGHKGEYKRRKTKKKKRIDGGLREACPQMGERVRKT